MRQKIQILFHKILSSSFLSIKWNNHSFKKEEMNGQMSSFFFFPFFKVVMTKTVCFLFFCRWGRNNFFPSRNKEEKGLFMVLLGASLVRCLPSSFLAYTFSPYCNAKKRESKSRDKVVTQSFSSFSTDP